MENKLFEDILNESKYEESAATIASFVTPGIVAAVAAAATGFVTGSGEPIEFKDVVHGIKKFFNRFRVAGVDKDLSVILEAHKEEFEGLSATAASKVAAKIVEEEDPELYEKIKKIGLSCYDSYRDEVGKILDIKWGTRSKQSKWDKAKEKYGIDGNTKIFESMIMDEAKSWSIATRQKDKLEAEKAAEKAELEAQRAEKEKPNEVKDITKMTKLSQFVFAFNDIREIILFDYKNNKIVNARFTGYHNDDEPLLIYWIEPDFDLLHSEEGKALVADLEKRAHKISSIVLNNLKLKNDLAYIESPNEWELYFTIGDNQIDASKNIFGKWWWRIANQDNIKTAVSIIDEGHYVGDYDLDFSKANIGVNNNENFTKLFKIINEMKEINKNQLFENIIKMKEYIDDDECAELEALVNQALDSLDEVGDCIYKALDAKSKDEREGTLKLSLSWIDDVRAALNDIESEL